MDLDRSSPAARAWVNEAIRRVEADANRSADTHLIPFPLTGPLGSCGIDLYLKDESTHPTGSLKHRLARSLFLYALCNGEIQAGTTVTEASSGSTAISEAHFARMLGLPFIAVMPRSVSTEKIALIEREGGRCHLVDDPTTVYSVAAELARSSRWRLPRPIHVCRASHRLAGQQQHRRIDLRADGIRAVSGAPLDRRRGRYRRHERDGRTLRPLPPLRHGRRGRRPGELGVLSGLVRRRPGIRHRAAGPASRASAGPASSRASCPAWLTG